MEPALDVIHRALHGDPGARSFLERTTSIYVLDVTDTSKPKTYGCWNFIHQAMNEVERHEARFPQHSNLQTGGPVAPELVSHTRLLATMALRVARRSPATDKILVATCISNASEYSGTESQSQWLIDLNLELREIVMGRIAAMAFDFSFHRNSGSHANSAFADRVVMDTFCAILSANAVASGPVAIRHFATEWIIPSSRNLPSFAVAAVVLHLAGEGMRKSAPSGTKDILQQLSVPAMQVVLVPTLSEAITENGYDLNASGSHEDSSLVAAMCLRAIKTWCDATDLSLPQIKHICSKVNADVIGVLSDSMYSDSHHVIDSLAELIEATVVISDEKVLSEGRMNQVRHIIGVDELTFKTQFTSQQLKTIESHEMASIVDELLSAVGLQRFRFVERQGKGDFDVCRNLARIGASVCGTWLDISSHERSQQPERGAVGLLVKAAAHPSVNICAISLVVLTRIVPLIPAFAQELLPVLQRRAITPHHLRGGFISLDASDLCGVNFHEFQNFRENVLTDALIFCWKAYQDHYMDSCASAVEEFCSGHASPVNVSLQLEAALFCIEKVGTELMRLQANFPHDVQMRRLVTILSSKPSSIAANALTRERMCCFLRKFCAWFLSNDCLDAVSDLAMSCFLISSAPNSESVLCRDSNFELSPSAEAARALEEFFCACPKQFSDEASLAKLYALWEASYMNFAKGDRDLTIEGRLALCRGLCYVLASLSGDKRTNSFESLTTKALERLEYLVNIADNVPAAGERLTWTLSAISDEIRIISTMSRSFTDACSPDYSAMQSGCDSSPERLAPIQQPILDIIGKGWRNIIHTASNWADDQTIAGALSTMLSEFLPPTCNDELSLSLLRELSSVAQSIRKTSSINRAHYDVIFEFTGNMILLYGEQIEKGALATFAGIAILENDKEVSRILEELIVHTVGSVQESLGNVWTIPGEQGNGQDAFESKPAPVKKPLLPRKPNGSLTGVLNLLKKCLDTCPNFLLHLPAAPRGDDMLLRRAVNSAVESLNDYDPELTRSSISFMKSLIALKSSPHENLQSFAAESLTRYRDVCINRSILGSCGKYEYTMIEEVANFLKLLISSSTEADIRSSLVTSLQTDQFLLGDQARNTALMVLLRYADNPSQMDSNELSHFLEDVWKLHQVEDTDSLPASDEVARFLHRYS